MWATHLKSKTLVMILERKCHFCICQIVVTTKMNGTECYIQNKMFTEEESNNRRDGLWTDYFWAAVSVFLQNGQAKELDFHKGRGSHSKIQYHFDDDDGERPSAYCKSLLINKWRNDRLRLVHCQHMPTASSAKC